MFEAWILKSDIVKSEEERLREAVRNLEPSVRAKYFKEYNRILKDPDTYAVLNWFFLAGIHHLYLGNILRGVINLLIMFLGIVLLFSEPLVGVMLIAAVVLIEIPALFRSQIIVANQNTKAGLRLLEKEHVTSSSIKD